MSEPLTSDPVQQVMRLAALFGAALVLGAVVLYPAPSIVLGVVAGVGLALGNTVLISRHVGRLFAGQLTGFSVMLFLLKFTALTAVLYVLIVPLELNPLAVLVGFTTLAFAVTASAFVALRGAVPSAE